MTDYQKTLIYRIICTDLTVKECYVGHTTNFTKRKSQHKFSCNTPTNNRHNLRVYQFIREHGGWNNWTMVEIEKFPCVDSNEARTRERYWIETFSAELNTFKAILTDDDKKQYSVQYYEQNKEKFTLYSANNKESIKGYKKRYQQQNKERISKKKKLYYAQKKNALPNI